MTQPELQSRSVAEVPAGILDDIERAVMNNLYDGVYYVDLGRRIHYWNFGTERLTGYADADVIGQFCFDNILNHVDGNGTALCHSLCPLAATMRDGGPREAEVFLRHRQGHRVPVQVRTAPVRNRDGAVIGGMVAMLDQSICVADEPPFYFG
jgi:PAS domain S-box-containing protein